MQGSRQCSLSKLSFTIMSVAKKSFGQYKCSSRPMIMAISPTVLRPITGSFYFAAANFADNCWRQKRTRLGLCGKRAAVDWERCANVQMCKCGETNLPPRLGTCFEEIIQIQRNFLVQCPPWLWERIQSLTNNCFSDTWILDFGTKWPLWSCHV